MLDKVLRRPLTGAGVDQQHPIGFRGVRKGRRLSDRERERERERERDRERERERERSLEFTYA